MATAPVDAVVGASLAPHASADSASAASASSSNSGSGSGSAASTSRGTGTGTRAAMHASPSSSEPQPLSYTPTAASSAHALHDDEKDGADGSKSASERDAKSRATSASGSADGDAAEKQAGQFGAGAGAGADGEEPAPPPPIGPPEVRAEDLDFPEGGLRAWSVIASSWVFIFLTWGLINTFGVYQEYYSRTILSHKSPDEIAWIGSFQYFLVFALGIICGRAFDMGLLKPLLLVGIVIWVVCQMLLSISTSYWSIFLVQGLGLGIADGICFNLSVAVPAHFFKRRRAFAFGLQATGSSIGGTVLPIMVTKLIPRVGFPWTMRILGFMGLAMFSVAWCGIRTRLPPIASVRNGGWKKVQWMDLSAFKVPAYTIFNIGAFISFLGIYNVFTYNQVFVNEYNVPAGAYFLSILNASSTFGRAIPGYYADRVGPFNMIVPCLILAAVLLFVFPLCTSLAGLIPFSILYGAASGVYVSIIPACIAGLGPLRTVGTRTGQSFAAVSIAGLIGTPIGGAILGDGPQYRWWAVMGWSGAVTLLGTSLIFVSRMLVSKGKFATII